MWKEKATDYRRFRLDRLNTPEFKHLKYLLFWPVYGFFFLLVERLWIRESYTPIHCPLDDRIPFCEYFLIPYLLWFVFLIGIQIYTLLYDTESFKKIYEIYHGVLLAGNHHLYAVSKLPGAAAHGF